jgi:hypothetical protein
MFRMQNYFIVKLADYWSWLSMRRVKVVFTNSSVKNGIPLFDF